MVAHMKTTIDIADHLLERAKLRASHRKVTLRALIEESLSASLDQQLPETKVTPVTFKGKGLSREFADASWSQIQAAIYP